MAIRAIPAGLGIERFSNYALYCKVQASEPYSQQMGNMRIYMRHGRVINERISGWQSKSNNKSDEKVKVMSNLLLANKEVKP
jgi:hypothetical protein